jgi:hypothetical protein
MWPRAIGRSRLKLLSTPLQSTTMCGMRRSASQRGGARRCPTSCGARWSSTSTSTTDPAPKTDTMTAALSGSPATGRTPAFLNTTAGAGDVEAVDLDVAHGLGRHARVGAGSSATSRDLLILAAPSAEPITSSDGVRLACCAAGSGRSGAAWPRVRCGGASGVDPVWLRPGGPYPLISRTAETLRAGTAVRSAALRAAPR